LGNSCFVVQQRKKVKRKRKKKKRMRKTLWICIIVKNRKIRNSAKIIIIVCQLIQRKITYKSKSLNFNKKSKKILKIFFKIRKLLLKKIFLKQILTI
jgi:hypothetical protein